MFTPGKKVGAITTISNEINVKRETINIAIYGPLYHCFQI